MKKIDILVAEKAKQYKEAELKLQENREKGKKLRELRDMAKGELAAVKRARADGVEYEGGPVASSSDREALESEYRSIANVNGAEALERRCEIQELLKKTL